MPKPCCQNDGDASVDGCCRANDAVSEVHATEVSLVTLRPAAVQDALVASRALVSGGYVGPSIPLTQLRIGQAATVRSIDMDPKDASMLRAMGLRVNARVRICRLGEPCIIELLGGSAASMESTADCPRGASCTCRLGLARPLAQRVMVGVS